MILMAFVVAALSWFVELMLLKRFPWLFQWAVKYPLFNLFSSLFLSWGLTQFFVASGLVCLMAGALSTGMSWLTYRGIHAYSQLRNVVPLRKVSVA